MASEWIRNIHLRSYRSSSSYTSFFFSSSSFASFFHSFSLSFLLFASTHTFTLPFSEKVFAFACSLLSGPITLTHFLSGLLFTFHLRLSFFCFFTQDLSSRHLQSFGVCLSFPLSLLCRIFLLSSATNQLHPRSSFSSAPSFLTRFSISLPVFFPRSFHSTSSFLSSWKCPRLSCLYCSPTLSILLSSHCTRLSSSCSHQLPPPPFKLLSFFFFLSSSFYFVFLLAVLILFFLILKMSFPVRKNTSALEAEASQTALDCSMTGLLPSPPRDTTNPIVTTSSVLGITYKDGILMVADTLGK